jgi:hypothetical protein
MPPDRGGRDDAGGLPAIALRQPHSIPQRLLTMKGFSL